MGQFPPMRILYPCWSFVVGYQVKPYMPVTAGVAHRPTLLSHS